VLKHTATSAWLFYLLAALLTLAWKWASWCHTGKKTLQKGIWISTKEWFDITLFEDKLSWITTIGVVWIFGVIYIDRVTWAWFGWIQEIPIHEAVAFFFGSLMEFVAPAAAKFVLSKIPYADSSRLN